METKSVKLEALPRGAAFDMPWIGLSGWLLNVGPGSARVRWSNGREENISTSSSAVAADRPPLALDDYVPLTPAEVAARRRAAEQRDIERIEAEAFAARARKLGEASMEVGTVGPRGDVVVDDVRQLIQPKKRRTVRRKK